jgi:methyl-accepting chemotaxis protein
MQINMPITTVEYVLKESDSLESKTDLKGNITYVNEDFLRISGFTKAELIGTPHNIVRHPDMPEEAFADMWNTLKESRPWTGLVKNRCKNGDFYWVMANSTPYYENEQMQGYLSVRSMPSREQINMADAAYRLFKDGKASNLKIQDGKIVNATLLSRLSLFKNATIKSRFLGIIGLLCVFMLSIGGMGLYGMNQSQQGIDKMYSDSTVPILQLTTIQKLLLTNRIRITASLSASSPEELEKNLTEVENNIEQINTTWKAYISADLFPEEKVMANKFADDRKLFVEEGLTPVAIALRANDKTLAASLITDKVRPLYEPVGDGIQNLLQLQIDVAKHELEQAQIRFGKLRNISIGVLTTAIILGLWLGLSLLRYIISSLKASVRHIAVGNYNHIIDVKCQDEIGQVMNALKSMQINLGFELNISKTIADENLRIKVGLDSSSSAITLSGTDTLLIHMTPVAKNLLASIGGPGFNVESLYGNSLSSLFNNPETAAKFDRAAQTGEDVDLFFNDHHLRLAARPIIDNTGKSLGRVTQWLDRTSEVVVEQEVATIVHGAVMGDFTRRIDMKGKEGFVKQLGEGLNELLETTESGINDVVRVLGALSRSDLTQTITNDYAGSLGQLKNDANTTVEKLKETINQIKQATDNINTGAKEIASGNNDLSHRTEEQAASLEETAASMEELTSTVQHNANNAKQANQLAAAASGIAEKGVEVVDQVVVTMADINDSSRRIGDIISVIDDIAFQTNILALNAAVEAARAGEQGRGFAVVAVEVRNLAQRAAAAAGEIKNLIDDSVTKVAGGSKLVTQAGLTMTEIVNSIHGVTVMMSEISAASTEQTAGIEQVNQAIGQMDDVTQQNAALVEQAAAAAESLEEQAQSLSSTVNQFKVDSYSHARTSMSAAKPSSSFSSAPQKTSAVRAVAKPKPIPQASSDEWEEF